MALTAKLTRLFGGTRPPQPAEAAYAAIVAEARQPAWFTRAGVPDSVDGRFDALALVLSLVLARAQREGDRVFEAALVDRFADDMDASFREMGVGDLSISKTVGQATGALGGRLTAYRDALASGAGLDEALARNLYRGAPPSPDALAAAHQLTGQLATRIDAAPWEAVAEGRW
jgi:cytochrome b pre-mRNA-processing protein 3